MRTLAKRNDPQSPPITSVVIVMLVFLAFNVLVGLHLDMLKPHLSVGFHHVAMEHEPIAAPGSAISFKAAELVSKVLKDCHCARTCMIAISLAVTTARSKGLFPLDPSTDFRSRVLDGPLQSPIGARQRTTRTGQAVTGGTVVTDVVKATPFGGHHAG